MSEIVGREVKRWSETLTELNEYDITLVNILLKHCEDLIEAGGTAGGKRANKIAEYIGEKQGVCDKTIETLSFGSEMNTKKIKKLNGLEVDSFRGFSVSRTFNLDKQYVFLYGPNGSGKSSFSEALEYSLLGVIEEADANKIKLSTYIKNTATKKGKKPTITCTYEDGSEDEAIIDYDAYRFAFVEKNRIADFSHISVLNSKNQSERIAALFGLSAFNEFVQGFTTNFDEKYLTTSSVTEKLFEEKKLSRDSKEKQLQESKDELNRIRDLLVEEIAKLKKREITEVDSALDYLENPTTGILTVKIAERDKHYVTPIPVEHIESFINYILKLQKNLKIVNENRNKLSDMALQVNYKNLYEIISELEETTNCPACGTNLANAERNPYEYAKEQLKTFTEIELIQKKINDAAQNARENIREILDFISGNQEFFKLLQIKTDNMVSVELEDIRMYVDTVSKWFEFCEELKGFDKIVARNKIEEYNKAANKSNSEYDQQVAKLSAVRNALVTLKTQMNEKEQIIKRCQKEIKEFDEQSEDTIKKIHEEKRICEFNVKIIEAYNKIIGSLVNYNNELPRQIAQDLEQKIVDYYNTINHDDADFEKIEELILPDATSDKMYITFADGSTSEALQVLSEGHIKILGLSILLAKAVHDNLNFIIFDDIVNAIDDDHRNGVADLLMNHADFANTQIILSTHGDQFIFKLQDKLGQKRVKENAIVYKFIPADSLEERGVIVEYSDSKTPLMAAEDKYNKNETKDAASKCRQAMECISYNLWNLIAKSSDATISVGMRSPKSLPDLSSIVDGLIKKTGKIKGMEDINAELKSLKEAGNWRVLNKGTHFEDEQKEFERADIKCVYDHLVKLDDMIRNMKIVNSAETK
ncbi:MAG: AAA family ATPase [Bacteroides sp.]